MEGGKQSYTVLKRTGERLKYIGSLRDGFLIAAAAFYFFGYIVWAINAYRNDLGLLPAFEFQYFIAGIAPVLIIIALFFLVVGEKWLRETVRAWIGLSPKGRRLYLCVLMLFLAIGAVVVIMTSSSEGFKTTFPNAPRNLLVLIGVLIIMVSPIFINPLENAFAEGTPFQKFFKLLHPLIALYLGVLALVYALLLFIGLAALAFIYCVELYPRIPQAFGGARPYYACLDVVKAQMSPETIEGLLPPDANKSHESVVRSSRLEVLFSGSDVMLVRSRGKVYKITKSTIQTIAMCD